ncbi:hypothetical protein Pla22_41480 [Rubripirellula amarantea]|uniref:DUF58 domain-containing protein n=1 Tax=Rubripirellula amarantea TaxID=2527999 RepID=A0A5C5WMP8_9BACT|nr:DUF58 domain-containing protein [Rubripirellula amarantea]TWT51371.1 hypothetical protein Pla22_41480 [Rubripirellula amarantea]
MGSHFVFVGTFAMLGGALRGFNLLLILAGIVAGTLIMHWRWSRRSVESISIRRRLPSEAFAGVPFRVRYRLRNHSRFMPAWMIRVSDEISHVGGTDTTTATCAVGVISASTTTLPHYDATITARGLYTFGPMSISTTFPFSLFHSRQVVSFEQQFCVFPALLSLKGSWQRQLISRSGGTTTTAKRSGQSEGEFFGLREWQTGDSPKWIHWRTTARLDQPAVRQFEQQRRFDMCILVDAYQQRKVKHQTSPNSVAVERAISLAATLLVRLVGSPSNRMILAVAGTEASAIVGGGSNMGKRRMLETLSCLSSSPTPELCKAIELASDLVGKAQDLIVISPRSLKEATESNSNLQEIIAPWVRRGSFRWIDTSDKDLNRWVSTEKPNASLYGHMPTAAEVHRFDGELSSPNAAPTIAPTTNSTASSIASSKS